MISVIVPNYNKCNFIVETLQSVKVQTSSDWEVIIVDDASDDSSVLIIKDFIQGDPRFRLFLNNIQKGGSSCRNQGLKFALGEFVIFLDSDDVLSGECLQLRQQTFESTPANDFLVFPMGTFKETIGDRKKKWCPRPKQNHLFAFLRHSLPWQTMQPIWRRGSLESLGGFDEDYPRLQDVELHTRALLNPELNYRIVSKSEPDCFYRVSAERIVGSNEEFMTRWVDGVNLYLKKMSDIIRESNPNCSREIAFLKGTFFSMINRLLLEHRRADIGRDSMDSLMNSLYAGEESLKLLSARDKLLLRLYVYGFGRGFSRIKGYNFLFRKALTLSL